MVFSSSTFLFLFLPLFFILYFAFPWIIGRGVKGEKIQTVRNVILCIFSLIFYAWGEPVYVGLMIFSSVVDFCNGVCIEKFPKHKKVFMVFSVIVNLSLLGFFKYSTLLINTIDGIFDIGLTAPNLSLPIGISFYTFQTMSYSIDVYRGKVKTEHNFLDFMAYVSMFPQLIAGPIVRYSTVSHELHHRKISFDSFSEGMQRFLTGLFKKVLIANSVGALFNSVTNTDIASQSAMTLWIAVLAFTLQIFFDFSGYTDMAIGMGKMIGFTFPENFNYPYIADSISEFWRRWHMSLTTWFRDYVYIPLGGSRKGTLRTIVNIFIVWALTGIWHGAEWNFMLWGIYFGILLMIEKFVLKKILDKTPKVIKHIYVCFFVMIGWVIFSFSKVSDIGSFIAGMFNFNNLIDDRALFLFEQYKIVLLIAIIFSMPVVPWIKKKLPCKNKKLESIIHIVLSVAYIALFILSVAMIISESYNPFLYFRF